MTEKQFLDDLEKKLWISANKLLPSLDAALYKHVVLGMVFVKYVSDSFKTRQDELKIAFNDEQNEYYLKDNARLSIGSPLPFGGEFKGVGKLMDDAMDLIEKENPALKRILNKNYAQLQIEQSKLADLLDLISTIPFTHETLKSKDILGHVYEYFLGQFAAAEGKKGGQFYTPKSIVNLIIEMVEPFSGRIYDPAMGSGGFFISSEKFIESHSGKIKDISVYGQESNHTTWKLAAMNMAIRGIDFNFGKEPAGTFTNDQHPDLRADFVLANPPLNQDEWWDASLENDVRWKDFGTPPKGNGDFAWMMHMIHHTSPNGVLGIVLANGSLSSTTGGEGKIRETIVKADLVEAIVALPSQLFSNTQIPASIWILNKNKTQKGKTLFIDARENGYMLDRKQRAFDDIKDIKTLADTFHNFRSGIDYEDIKGQYFSASVEDISKQEYILTPGRYVGVVEEEDDGIPFKDKMESLTSTLKEQFEESDKLEKQIKKNFLGFGYEI